MRLTRRGFVVIGVALLAFVLGAEFGARSLDVVTVPAIAVLALAVVQVALMDPPTIERSVPEPGFPGDHRMMRLRLDTSGIARITDTLGRETRPGEPGLHPHTVDRTVAGAQTIEYEIEFLRRGVYEIGPLLVTVRDALGLVTTQYRYTNFGSLVVYPPIRQLTSPTPLGTATDARGQIERQEFDRLRKYIPGDSLRDVHWKTSAKRQDDLFVVEYAQNGRSSVSIVAEATADRAGTGVDAMATATASIATHLLDNGIDVTLTVPDGQCETEHTGSNEALLDLLSRTAPGRVSTEHAKSTDIYIFGDQRQTTVTIDDRRFAFDELITSVPNKTKDADRNRGIPA